jgi:hypothetical protein
VQPQIFAHNATRVISIQFFHQGHPPPRLLKSQPAVVLAKVLPTFAYPYNATNLPVSCGIIVKVTSSVVPLILPDEWNNRFMAVGNGGFSGGINWVSMGSLVPYGLATMSTNTDHNSTG